MNVVSYLKSLLGKDYLRRDLLKHTDSEVMKKYLSCSFPDKNTLVRHTDIVSLDVETTGLNSETDQIISIGVVTISSLGIKLDTCWHQLIQTSKNIPEESVVIHNITDDQLISGITIDRAIPLLLDKLQGKVVLVHNAKVEQSFINEICLRLYKTGFVMPVIDTQRLAKRRLDRQGVPYKSKDLRLFNLRKKLNMPVYKAHNALLDAIATAELFLAILNDVSPKNNARLKEFLS